MEPALIVSIISITITALFGLWNFRISRENHQMRKDEFIRNRNKDLKEEFDNRPRLEIVLTKKNIEGKAKSSSKADIDCLVVPIKNYSEKEKRQIFEYDKAVINKLDWVYIEFRLKNTGKSIIDHLYVSWNSAKNTSMFDVKNDEYLIFIGANMLNYRVMLEEHIKPGQEFTLRFNFHKDMIMYGMISAEASIWMFDEYKKIWEQPLFVHRNIIYDSQNATHDDFRNMTDIKDALECFKNPYLW